VVISGGDQLTDGATVRLPEDAAAGSGKGGGAGDAASAKPRGERRAGGRSGAQ
jgi:multidrug efflux system membrane fusion protein